MTVVAGDASLCESKPMKHVPILLMPLALGGCVTSVAKTAFDVVTLPVKIASAGVNAVTTSQSEADERRGRELRKADEQRARDEREAAKGAADHPQSE
jgi:hypothetical protein